MPALSFSVLRLHACYLCAPPFVNDLSVSVCVCACGPMCMLAE